MQCLRAEHHIDVGRAFTDRFSLLAGDATANRDAHIRILLFQRPPASQLMEHLLLCFFADRASIQQQYVSLFSRVHQDRAVVLLEQIKHSRGIIFIHLAAVSFDEHALLACLLRLC